MSATLASNLLSMHKNKNKIFSLMSCKDNNFIKYILGYRYNLALQITNSNIFCVKMHGFMDMENCGAITTIYFQ